MRTRVKICGITRQQDAYMAVMSGADAIGLVFYPDSPRVVDAAGASKITSELPAFVSVVGLFVDAQPMEVQGIIENTRLDLLQFHGNETPEVCRGFGLPYIKAIRMHDDVDLNAESARYYDACGLLLDTYHQGTPGGTGELFDWGRVTSVNLPVILAGGLTPGNVAKAINSVRPYAVDVSSGVETAKGIKDPDKVSEFIRNVIKS